MAVVDVALVGAAEGSERPAVAESQPARLPLRTVLVYGFPAVGLSLPNMLLGLYFFKFATDVLLLAPGILGL